MNSKVSKDSSSRHRDWIAESIARNTNLKPLAGELSKFTEENFSAWIEKAMIRMVIEGKPEETCFSPGELIIGTSPYGWRDDLFAVIALLEDSAKACAVRGIIDCFDGVAPRPDDNDVTANGGRNWEQYVAELMRLVRDLRPPLCDREATPLGALHQLLTLTFPNSQAVLDEGLVLWRAFAHQIKDDDEWATTFMQHSRFRDEYTPLVAFAHVVRFPSKALYYLSKWTPYRQYRRKLLHEAVEDSNAKDSLQELYGATDNVVQYANDRGLRIGYEEIATDPTYSFHSPVAFLNSFKERQARSSIVSAEKMARSRPARSIADFTEDTFPPSRRQFEKLLPKNCGGLAGIGAGL